MTEMKLSQLNKCFKILEQSLSFFTEYIQRITIYTSNGFFYLSVAGRKPKVWMESNKRGGKILIVDGYRYHRYGSGQRKLVRYLCRCYKALGCQAKCQLDVKNKKLIFIDLNHNHGINTK